MYPNCSRCNSLHIVKKGLRKTRTGDKQRYLCTECNSTFIEPDGFERMRHDPKIIVKAIHMHIDGFSLFKTQYHLYQHEGVKVTKRTISKWTKKYGSFLKSNDFRVKTKIKRKTTSG